VLVAAVPDVGDLAALVVDRLRALEVPRPALVHGDLVPANVLVDDAGEVTAVLDLGFLTTLGDPAFDAAVTASITDMYGVRARRTEAVLDARLGHPADRVATHRLAYALVTATVYSVSGSDGHFAWCAAMLRRPDLRDLVGAPAGPR
jgi:aminoglycoside phosphotransferase (APT) family kinase protein